MNTQTPLDYETVMVPAQKCVCDPPWGYALWSHLHDQHGLTLLESELAEIIRLAVAINRAKED